MVRAQLGAKTNWTDSNDLAMMFKGTYPTPFYRKLHHLLHEALDLRRRLYGERSEIRDWRLPTEDQSPISNLQSSIADVLNRLDRLNSAWFELGQMEVEYRNDAPTVLIRQNGHLPVPDLSKEWN
jgi:hypothetical protein